MQSTCIHPGGADYECTCAIGASISKPQDSLKFANACSMLGRLFVSQQKIILYQSVLYAQVRTSPHLGI